MPGYMLGNHTIIYQEKCRHLEIAEKINPLCYFTSISLLLVFPVLKGDKGVE